MPRRIPDYPDAYEYFNTIETFGSLCTFVGLFILYSAFTKNVDFIVNNISDNASLSDELINDDVLFDYYYFNNSDKLIKKGSVEDLLNSVNVKKK